MQVFDSLMISPLINRTLMKYGVYWNGVKLQYVFMLFVFFSKLRNTELSNSYIQGQWAISTETQSKD